MQTLSDVKKKINEIKNSDFKIREIDYYNGKQKVCNLLRSALICCNAISSIANISEVREAELYKELDEVMKNKIKALNSNFSEEILNNMVCAYKRGYIIYPMDIFVIDDAVFHKEGKFNDFDDIYEIQTFMFEDLKPYYNISDIAFTLDDEDEEDFLTQKEVEEEKKDDIFTSKFISNNINSIYKENITVPLCELNTATTLYGHKGLVSREIGRENIYINMKFDDIKKSLKKGNECDIKICIQNKEELTLYYVHQSFKDNKPVWCVVKTSSEVWRLTDEILKFENKCVDNIYKLTKKRKSDLF